MKTLVLRHAGTKSGGVSLENILHHRRDFTANTRLLSYDIARQKIRPMKKERRERSQR